MSQSGNPSNEKLRRENIAKLEQYLSGLECVPERRGEANLSGIAIAAGVRRTWLYDDVPKAMIQEAAAAKGLGVPHQQRALGGDRVPAGDKQRIKALEERLAVAQAEVRDLRGRIKSYQHLERHMVDTGRLPR